MKSAATVAELFFSLHYHVVRNHHLADMTASDQKHVVIPRCLTIATATPNPVRVVLFSSKRRVSAARRLSRISNAGLLMCAVASHVGAS